VIGFSKQCLAT